MTFFDTSAVIALVNDTETLHNWSRTQFTNRLELGPVIINDMVYAEIAAGMSSQCHVDAIIQQFGFERAGFSNQALYAAGQRFALYKRNKGPKLNVLADFLIGAAAQTAGATLVTGNPRDFRKFFKGLNIVSPKGIEVVK